MQIKSNKNRVSTDTDKHICKYLLSSFHSSGFKSYKKHYGVDFPKDATKAISNRINYLKNLQSYNFPKFSELIQLYGITSADDPVDLDHSYDSDPSTSSYTKPSYSKRLPKPKEKQRTSKMFGEVIKKHQHFLNPENSSFNHNGMLWFRDDDVEIDEAFCSVLTIYQPLFDARDQDLISLKIDEADNTSLLHTYPVLLTFLYKDFGLLYEIDDSKDNPEVYSSTKKKHKKLASQLKKEKEILYHTSEYRLPFSLNLEAFDAFKNSNTELQKNYRYFEIVVHNEIVHSCAYLYWKVLVEGETHHFGDEDKRNNYEVAQDHLNRMFDKMKTEDKEQL